MYTCLEMSRSFILPVMRWHNCFLPLSLLIHIAGKTKSNANSSIMSHAIVGLEESRWIEEEDERVHIKKYKIRLDGGATYF